MNFNTNGSAEQSGSADPVEKVLSRLHERGCDPKQSGSGKWRSRCPVKRGDRDDTLSIGVGDNGCVTLHCFAHDCSHKAIAEALGLTEAELFRRDGSKPSRNDRAKAKPKPETVKQPKPEKKGRVSPTLDAAIASLERRIGKSVARWIYRDADGTDAMAVARFENGKTKKNGKRAKEFRPFHPVEGGWRNGDPPGDLPLFNLPDIPNASQVYVCEGEKCVDSLKPLGLTATTSAHGGMSPRKTDWKPLSGKHVVILPDNDDTGESFAAKVQPLLAKIKPPPASVKVVAIEAYWDGPEPPREKDDVVNWIDRGTPADWTDDDRRACLETAAEQAEPIDLAAFAREAEAKMDEDAGDDRPEIHLTTEIHEMVDQAEAVLSRDPDVFQRLGSLVRVLLIDGRPVIRDLGEHTLAERLTRGARWIGTSFDGTPRRKKPPRDVIGALVARGIWKDIRPIRAVVETPCLASDGRAIVKSGYDPASGLLAVLDGDYPPLNDEPTFGDAKDAAYRLLDLVKDFPFASEEFKSSWLAALLALVARPAIDGPCPMFTFDANTPGSGKSLLCDVIGLIATGRKMPRMAMPSNRRDADDEMSKRLTAMAMEGRRATLFDDVAEPIGLPSLNGALTGTGCDGRVLGESRMVVLRDATTCFYATGNNIRFRGDFHRRAMLIRLESHLEHPETRDDVTIRPLDKHVETHRRELLIDALTILRAFVVAGKPTQRNAILGSYESFCHLVGAAVMWTTGLDPFQGRDEVTDRDDDRESLAAFIAGWAELDGGRDEGVSGRDAISTVRDNPKRHPMLADAFTSMSHQEWPTPKQLSARLKACKSRVIDGQRIAIAGKPHGVTLWRVESVEQANVPNEPLRNRKGFHREPEQVGMSNGHSELL